METSTMDTDAMDTLTPLICDLLEWLARAPRTHAEVMDGWRTSCPRLPVWEEATDRGYVARRGALVEVTPHGRSFLVEQRPLDAEQRTGVNPS
jgi:hypothetical protein